DFPHIWLNAGNPDAIVKLTKGGKVAATFDVKGAKTEILKTHNVVGMVEGTDPVLKNEYIIYSAHYDHVGIGRADETGDTIYNGARDNAVGSVTVLSAAENLAKYPTKRSAIFIFFTGEEKGLLGSAYYADNPAIPLDQVVYCFNSDNGGYNDTSRASIIGLERTGAEPLIRKACAAFGLDAKPDAAPEQNLFDRSDNVNFAKKGVPAPTFSLGYTAFDDEINKYYHQPGDEPATLDYVYLTKFFKSYVYSCRLIGNTDTSVFWRKGDKYYEAGERLYGDRLKD
ncbi:MAG: M28 family peptidase, partial [Bacteroidota bacterium]